MAFPLPSHQRDSNVRFLAIQFYMDVMDFTEPIEKRHVWPEVRKCLVPLLCHLDDDVEKVAEVRISSLTRCFGRAMPWRRKPLGGTEHPEQGLQEGAGPPPCVPRPSPTFLCLPCLRLPRGTGRWTQVLSPGQWWHLSISVALQAALKTLTFAAKFLKESQLKRLLRARDKYGAAEYLVRTAPKPQPLPGQAPSSPAPSVQSRQLCPCPWLQPGAASLRCAHTAFPQARSSKVSSGSSHFWSLGMPTGPWPSRAWASERHLSPLGSTLSPAPSRARPQHQPAAGWGCPSRGACVVVLLG